MEISLYPHVTTSELAELCRDHGNNKELPCPCGEFMCLLDANGFAKGKDCKDIDTKDWEDFFKEE